MNAEGLERMYQKELALHSDPNMIGLRCPVKYVNGKTLRQLLLEVGAMPRTTDDEELLDDEMYAVTKLWIYRVDD